MRTLPAIGLGLLLAAGAGVAVQAARWWADQRMARRAWDELAATRPADRGGFDPAMVDGLPEPARRYFLHAIEPGARLAPVVEVTMGGELSLGTREAPGTQPMQARQLLAAPHGFVWALRAGAGLLRVSGSDGMVAGRSWTRFWLLRTVAVARAGGDPDHLRSAFGRVVAEAVAWSPAALLPRAGVAWLQVDADTARVTVTHGALVQAVDVRVDASGQPLWVRMPRWSNANPEGVYRLQPFGGELGDFRRVDGYRLPFRLDGGNFFGTPQYLPFYRARVLAIRLH